MNKLNEATITISADEYFDLRQRAEANGILMQKLGELEGQLYDYDRRLWELENKQKER